MPRIVAIADTHGQHARLALPEGDILIHAGDMTPRGTMEQLGHVADWLRQQPHPHKIVIAGNHDFALQRDPQNARALFHGLTFLEDSEATVAGLRIWGSPWQPWFHNWAFNLQRGAELDEKWKLIPEGIDVLVTHGPPLGYGDLVERGERVGCEDLLRHLSRVKPRLHFFGHIHEDRGQWQYGPTKIVNCTVSDCDLPATVIDLP